MQAKASQAKPTSSSEGKTETPATPTIPLQTQFEQLQRSKQPTRLNGASISVEPIWPVGQTRKTSIPPLPGSSRDLAKERTSASRSSARPLLVAELIEGDLQVFRATQGGILSIGWRVGDQSRAV
jgi:hypothetical protein